MKPIQEHLGWTRDDSRGPFVCPEGWYVRGMAVVRGGILVGDAACILGGTIRGGTIRGGTIRGGTIEGGTIRGGTPPYAWCVRWEASVVSPGKIAVGCQTHPITHWLRKQHPDIPWRDHCTPDEQREVQACVRYLKSQIKYCDWKED